MSECADSYKNDLTYYEKIMHKKYAKYLHKKLNMLL